MRVRFCLLVLLLLAGLPARGQEVETLIPGPGETGFDAPLADLVTQYDRQFDTFNAAPFGMSLDSHVAGAAARVSVAAFLADLNAGTGPDAFLQFSGLDVFDVVDRYGEEADLGMFGGVAAAGDAYRYAVLRQLCAVSSIDCALADAARLRVLDILEALHIAHAIVGEKGVVVRGLFLRGTPFTGGDPAEIPLTDASGDPNPGCNLKPENPTSSSLSQALRFRPDATRTDPDDASSGQFPEWIFMDNASKDQLTGWVYAMGAIHDVVHYDPTIPQALKDRLAQDAATMGRRLMIPGGPLGIDMTIFDADGCVTTFHDLNPEEIEGISILALTLSLAVGTIPPDVRADILALRNGFNAILGLAIIRTFCHVSGAADVCSFYYDELVDTRAWPQILLQNDIPLDALPPAAIAFLDDLGFPLTATAIPALGVDLNYETNYSGANMAFIGLFGLLRYEPDPALRAIYAQALERVWDSGLNPRQPSGLEQSFFDFIYSGFRDGGTDDAAVAGGIQTLGEFVTPPYWNDAVENCDAAETAAGVCTAIDASTIVLAPVLGRSDALVAVDPVPKSIRPPSNFEWRSNPYAVNGGGGDRLNPGGDFRGAYWLGRFLRRGTDGLVNLAPGARGRSPALVSGKRVVVKDKSTDASKRKLVALSKDPSITTPAAGSSGDPRLNGAEVKLFNPVTGQSETFALPPTPFGDWKALGKNPEGKSGYKYSDKDSVNGPCKIVIVKPGGLRPNGQPKPGLAKAVCLAKVQPMSFALDDPDQQGTMGFTVQLGADTPVCAIFDGGATLLRDFGTGTKPSGVALFKAKDAPAPASCSVP